MTPETPGKFTGDAFSCDASAHNASARNEASRSLPWGGTVFGRIGYRKLQAPAEDGGLLVDPSLKQSSALLRGNLERQAKYDFEILGVSFEDFRRLARESMLNVAHQHTSGYRSIAARQDRRAVILSGHQPQLFHPGVWFKNFLLAAIGARAGAQPINLIIDNDTVRETSIRTPLSTSAASLVEAIPYDVQGPEIPFEERNVLDEPTFASFADRICATLPAYVGEARGDSPLVEALWRLTFDESRDEPNLGRRLAKMRNRFEAELIEAPWEAPLSEICRQEPFLRFACELLVDVPRFSRHYNEALDEYRRVHRIRNLRQPMPSLETASPSGDWNEAPFWLWTSGDPRRRRLFARRTGKVLELTDRTNVNLSLPLAPDRAADAAIEALLEVAGEGVKLRPRALVTTLYARLFLSDLFVHGIGGAKYDQVTDAIIERYFGVLPPAMITATATFRLPIERPNATSDELRRVECDLRDLRYRPEKFLAEQIAEKARDWVDTKRRWIETARQGESLTVEERRQRHAEISQANAALAPLVADRFETTMSERESLRRQRRVASILGSREFSFCLFPKQYLVDRMLQSASPKS